MIYTHGEYLRDMHASVHAHDITAEEAVRLLERYGDKALLEDHIAAYDKLDPQDPSFMTSKGWIALHRDVIDGEHIIVCLYKADDGFRLHHIEEKAIVERAERDASSGLNFETHLLHWCRKKGLVERTLPNAEDALRELRKVFSDEHVDNPPGYTELQRLFILAGGLFRRLDSWLGSGGPLPKEWEERLDV